jgi:hypothetical protein
MGASMANVIEVVADGITPKRFLAPMLLASANGF